jgi:hypothetical protein
MNKTKKEEKEPVLKLDERKDRVDKGLNALGYLKKPRQGTE